MQTRHPGRYWSVIGATSVVGGLALVYAVPRLTWPALASLAGVGFAIERLPAWIQDDVTLSLANVAIFTALLAGGPASGIMVAAGSGVAVCARHPLRQWLERGGFNIGQFTSSALAAGLALELLAPTGGLVTLLSSVQGLLALTVATVVFTLLNSGLVALVVSAVSGSSVAGSFRSFFDFLPLQFLYVGLAAAGALLWRQVGPTALILLAVPALIARHALLGFQAQSDAYDRLVRAFVKALEVKDGYTRGHADRVASLAEEIAREYELDHDQRRRVRYGALLHDIGKIRVPASIICKDGPLTDDEYDLIKEHPRLGTRILAGVEFLRPALDAVRHHHERWDGRGYPDGLAGEDIPLFARIVTAVDAFDAMTSTRPYRQAASVADAIDELDRHAGHQFDPDIVAALKVAIERLGWSPTDEPVRVVPSDPTSRASEVTTS